MKVDAIAPGLNRADACVRSCIVPAFAIVYPSQLRADTGEGSKTD